MSDFQGDQEADWLSRRKNDLSQAGIRSQLLWSSLFPLVFFCLLCVLAFSSSLETLMLDLASQRDAARIQFIAEGLNGLNAWGTPAAEATLDSRVKELNLPEASRLYVLARSGTIMAVAGGSSVQLPFDQGQMKEFFDRAAQFSRVIESTETQERVLVSFSLLSDGKTGVLLVEPWSDVMKPAYYYEYLIGGLLLAGILLSLGMLALSLGRIIRPISVLSQKAASAVPGSIFRPLPSSGPLEIRRLIDAFNRMVIRLADQQASIRQYAQKALLSQEEERERLSHELHDGTLQDLISLSQRVELCQNELDQGPDAARRRLDELHNLLGRTIDDVRRISSALRPPMLADLGLAIAVESLVHDLQQDRPNIRCELSMEGNEIRLAPDYELAIYRIVQEALTNIRRHASQADRVHVSLKYAADEIRVAVRNNGANFVQGDVRSHLKSGHLGLAGMDERARLLGGTLRVGNGENDTTVVTLVVPYDENSTRNMKEPHAGRRKNSPSYRETKRDEKNEN